MTARVIRFPGLSYRYMTPYGVTYYTSSSTSGLDPYGNPLIPFLPEAPLADNCPDCPLDKCIRYDPDEPRTCPKDRATGYVGDYKEGHPRRAVPAKVIPLATRRPRP